MHRNLGIGSWIARRARSTPGRVALIAGDRRWTYEALDDRITRLARGLEARGVRAGDRVAYLGPNHPAALETLLACGLLGAIAVPVHPGFDDDARARVLAAATPVVIVATPAEAAALVDAGSDEPLDRAVGLDAVALLAFSSGTTGPNKGVALTHGNLLFNVVNLLAGLDLVRDDVHLVSAPLYRMGGLGFALTVLFKGGALVLPGRDDPDALLAAIERERITVLFDAVGALERLSAAPAFASARLGSVRVCVTGGSYVSPSLVAAFGRRGICLQPGYGLTEAAPVALLVDRDEVAAHPGGSGRPTMLGAARVVDDDLEDVAPGEVGELIVAGPNLTPGYWRAPEATARAFVDGWLRTGDAARIDADGMITVVGRVADAVDVGGRRVDPEPIEDDLRGRGGVGAAALVQGAPGAPPALFVVAGDRPIDAAEVLAWCRARLGGATPALHVVEALPRNPNGKLLRHVLRAAAGPERRSVAAIPRG